MSDPSAVCLTFDAACEAAIEMENRIYRNYLQALRVVKNPAALDILRDAATTKLGHKYKLEQAALAGGIGDQVATGPLPTMNLNIRDADYQQIDAGADNRKALAYAIQMSKNALQFYRDMTEHCSGSPMAKIFSLVGDDQTRHLQQLEDSYEEHFLTEG